MILRREMLRAARSAPALLRDRAGAVVSFLRGRADPGGGFRGRSDQADLYYTLFGAEALLVLGAGLPENLSAYLHSFGAGESLDFVHLACLARLWADLDCRGLQAGVRAAIRARLAAFRAADGGFSHLPHAPCGTAYACFVGVGAWEDLEGEPPAAEGLVRCLESLRAADGGYANEPGRPRGLTTATAAAAALRAHLGRPADEPAREWLLARLHPGGGFAASAQAPAADLLSTATALHALARMGRLEESVKRPCRAFVESLWGPEGGFRAHVLDDAADCEYTWYGLLALGHLAGE